MACRRVFSRATRSASRAGEERPRGRGVEGGRTPRRSAPHAPAPSLPALRRLPSSRGTVAPRHGGALGWLGLRAAGRGGRVPVLEVGGRPRGRPAGLRRSGRRALGGGVGPRPSYVPAPDPITERRSSRRTGCRYDAGVPSVAGSEQLSTLPLARFRARTRTIQGRVPLRECWFDSSLGHPEALRHDPGSLLHVQGRRRDQATAPATDASRLSRTTNASPSKPTRSR